jgi:hypothetical protein
VFLLRLEFCCASVGHHISDGRPAHNGTPAQARTFTVHDGRPTHNRTPVPARTFTVHDGRPTRNRTVPARTFGAATVNKPNKARGSYKTRRESCISVSSGILNRSNLCAWGWPVGPRHVASGGGVRGVVNDVARGGRKSS